MFLIVNFTMEDIEREGGWLESATSICLAISLTYQNQVINVVFHPPTINPRPRYVVDHDSFQNYDIVSLFLSFFHQRMPGTNGLCFFSCFPTGLKWLSLLVYSSSSSIYYILYVSYIFFLPFSLLVSAKEEEEEEEVVEEEEEEEYRSREK